MERALPEGAQEAAAGGAEGAGEHPARKRARVSGAAHEGEAGGAEPAVGGAQALEQAVQELEDDGVVTLVVLLACMQQLQSEMAVTMAAAVAEWSRLLTDLGSSHAAWSDLLLEREERQTRPPGEWSRLQDAALEKINGWSEDVHRRHFHMSKAAAQYLCGFLSPGRGSGVGRPRMPALLRLYALLYWLTSGYYPWADDCLGMSPNSLHRYVRETLKELFETALEDIYFPEMKEEAEAVDKQTKMPHCLGAVDGALLPVASCRGRDSKPSRQRSWSAGRPRSCTLAS